jgi:hypothetical protein
MQQLDAFFHPHDGLTSYTDGFGAPLGTDVPDHMGGVNHLDSHGALTHHLQPDHMGGTDVHDAHNRIVAHIRHDPMGHTHVTDDHGREVLTARPTIFHGHDLFLANGQHMGGIHDLGGGHMQFQADPLVGMDGIRFPHFV